MCGYKAGIRIFRATVREKKAYSGRIQGNARCYGAEDTEINENKKIIRIGDNYNNEQRIESETKRIKRSI